MSSFIERQTIDDFLEEINEKNNSIFLTTNEEKKSKKSSNNKSYNAVTNTDNKTNIQETPYR